MPLIKLTNVQEVLVHNCWPVKGSKIFAEIKGADTKNVKMNNNELGDAVVVYGEEVTKSQL
jgi:hypothetical protein